MKTVLGVISSVLILGLVLPSVQGQTTASPDGQTKAAPPPTTRRMTMCELPDSCVTRTFYLSNSTQINDMNEIVTAMRNMVSPEVRVFSVPSQAAIVIKADAETFALIQKLLTDLDRPHKTYRLTYTITEMDGGKRIGVEHYSVVAAAGQAVTLKQGSKVPLVTGSFATESKATQTQVTYLDVGMNIAATPQETAAGAMLKMKIEQSGIAEEKSGLGPQDPVVRQTVIEGTSMVILGKPLMLGSIDVFGSTRHLDVEVVMDVVR